MKEIGKCTRSNKINSNFWTNSQGKPLCRYYSLLQDLGETGLLFLIKPPDQKIYIMYHKLMTIVNLVYIFCTTELSRISPKFKYINIIKVHMIKFPECSFWKALTISIGRTNFLNISMVKPDNYK